MVLLTTAYFAPIQYFSKLILGEDILIEKYETFGRQSYRNRCEIFGANGKQILSVPVIKGARKKIITKDIEIEYVTDWRKLHFKAIESAYRRSPFYEYYIDDIEPVFSKRHKYLLDLNNEIMNVFFEILDIDPSIIFTNDYVKDMGGLIDWREGIHPKESKRVFDNNFECKSYTQVFSDKHGFNVNLSILDLVFNLGSDALDFLEGSVINK